MSAITKEEFEAILDELASTECAVAVSPRKRIEIDIRAFFAALPGDVKLMRREPTEAMVLSGLHHEHMGDMAGRYHAMHNAAPPSLPEE